MDKRLSLALKYYDAKLIDDAWAAVCELMAEPHPSRETMHLAAALRFETGAFEDALMIAERLIAQSPESVDGWVVKGQALMATGQPKEAGALFMNACEREPQNADAQFNLGRLHHDAGRLKEAEEAYRIAVSARETFVDAWNNLGNVQDEAGRPKEARASFRKAIAQQADFSPAHNNLGASLAGQGCYVAAAASYTRAIEADPSNLSARVNLGVALLEQGDVNAAISTFDAVLAAAPDDESAAHNRLYAAVYREDAPENLMTAHRAWAQRRPAGERLIPDDPRPERRLRVGYISPDFRRHSVSYFVEPLLAGHNPDTVEVFCYSDVAQPDVVTARLKGRVHHWRNVCGQTNGKVRDLIRADNIDILVDLAGHTTGNRLSVFSQRAAPLQVTGLGYPATTGLANMDYRLCDRVSDPDPTADAWARETLIRLPDGLHCFQPSRDAPKPGPSLALKNGFVTFGSFNKLAKISPLTVTMWADVLRALPTARLVLKSKALAEEVTCAKVREMFAEQGVVADRLDLMGWESGDEGHMRLYERIDVALDTFPYNGTTTTCEALWMGVPVITLAGKGHAARVGASLLTQLGRDDWIVLNAADYVVCAEKLAADISGLQDMRGALRSQMAASSLCDGPRYAKSVEAAYRRIWEELCATSDRK